MTTFHTHGSGPPRCDHPVHLVARDVSAAIVNRSLAGEWTNGHRNSVRDYALIEFCQNPACERVFKSEPKR